MHGFIPSSRASIMLDVVAVALLAVIPALTWSIYLVRQRRYQLHKRIQVATGSVLFAAIVLFEVDIRTNGWTHLAKASAFYDTWLFPLLYVHLFVAVSTTLLWAYTIIAALKFMPVPPGPSPYSSKHRRVAKAAALGMYCTAVTGWTFYWMAFIA